MAVFRGVNNVARKVTKQWRGVGNVARQIKAEWRGVGNVARKVFTSGIVYLYNTGDECTSVTGGWAKSGYSRGSATAVKNSNNLTLSIKTSGNQTATMLTKNKINMSGYSKLIAKVEYTTTSSNGLARLMIVGTTENQADAQAAHKSIDNSYTGTLTLDVSGYTSSYYIGLQIDGWTNSKTARFKITEVWLE